MNLGDFWATLAALLWSVSVILKRVSGFSIAAVTLTFLRFSWHLLVFGMLVFEGGILISSMPLNEYGRLVLSAVLGITIADIMFVIALNILGANLQDLAGCVNWFSEL